MHGLDYIPGRTKLHRGGRLSRARLHAMVDGRVDEWLREPNRNKVGKITLQQLEEIAKIKMVDLNSFEMEKVMEQVKGTARSMGVDVAV